MLLAHFVQAASWLFWLKALSSVPCRTLGADAESTGRRLRKHPNLSPDEMLVACPLVGMEDAPKWSGSCQGQGGTCQGENEDPTCFQAAGGAKFSAHDGDVVGAMLGAKASCMTSTTNPACHSPPKEVVQTKSLPAPGKLFLQPHSLFPRHLLPVPLALHPLSWHKVP